MAEPLSRRAALAASFRANLVPGIGLWTLGLMVIAGYYGAPSLRPAYDTVAAIKSSGGVWFSLVSTGFFGGLLPFLLLLALGRVPRGVGWSWFWFFTLQFAWRGFEVDRLYTFQSWAFGDGPEPWRVATKVVVDQFGYTLLWAVPTGVLVFAWKHTGFRWAGVVETLRDRFWTHRLPVALASTWMVWIPAVSIVYSLPLPLQVPLFNLVLCFYVLVFEVLTGVPGKVVEADTDLALVS